MSAPPARPLRLDGDRVYLCRLGSEHTDLLVRWRSDPRVAAQMFSEKPPTRDEHEAWLAGAGAAEDRIDFVIVVREGDQPAGTITLSRIDRATGEAEYGIMIGEPTWQGRGIARDASLAVLTYAFETLRLRRIRLTLFADNSSARALYERLGFVDEPSLAGECMKDGVRRTTCTMALGREAWQARSTPQTDRASAHGQAAPRVGSSRGPGGRSIE